MKGAGGAGRCGARSEGGWKVELYFSFVARVARLAKVCLLTFWCRAKVVLCFLFVFFFFFVVFSFVCSLLLLLLLELCRVRFRNKKLLSAARTPLLLRRRVVRTSKKRLLDAFWGNKILHRQPASAHTQSAPASASPSTSTERHEARSTKSARAILPSCCWQKKGPTCVSTCAKFAD